MTTSVAALLLAALSADEIDPSVWITQGQRVPAVELPRIDGSGTLALAELRGRKLLLVQFASW